jgi:hypothetical protein
MAITGRLNVFEASAAAPRADATAPTVDQTSISVDAFNAGDIATFTGTVGVGGITGILGATEEADTAAFAGQVAELPIYGGGGLPWVPPLEPIEGVGFGLLPRLEGEAHGVIVGAGIGGAMLRNLAGEAAGAVGGGGQGEARLAVKAAASGARGSNGAAAAILDFGAVGAGAVVARGNGLAVIGNFEIIATGRQDDDEAAIIWLLAA